MMLLILSLLFLLTLILPSMICQQSSALSLLSLIESSLQRLLIISIYYILSVLMPYSLLYLPSMTSIRYLLNIFQHNHHTKLSSSPTWRRKFFETLSHPKKVPLPKPSSHFENFSFSIQSMDSIQQDLLQHNIAFPWLTCKTQIKTSTSSNSMIPLDPK
jgi:hypothetical protein